MSTEYPHLLARKLAENHALLCDGATGTNLFAMGLQTGDAPELWNIDHPDRIARHYRSFIDAGSDIILTNSFGGTRYRLKLHNSESRVHELNSAAARIASEQVADSGKSVVVAGSIGPTGEILEPNGPLSIGEAADAFAEQAQALKEGGVDVLWIETISSREEITAAVQGASQTGLPIVVTVSIDTNGRTMMGLTAHDVTELVMSLDTSTESQVIGMGANCGVGASELVVAVCNFSRASQAATATAGPAPVIVAKANCGIPEYVDGSIVYNGTPEIMQRYTTLSLDAGARIIGGCCGTTPAHIAAMREVIDNYEQSDPPDLPKIIDHLGDVSKGAAAQFAGDLSVQGGSASGAGERRTSRRKRRPR